MIGSFQPFLEQHKLKQQLLLEQQALGQLEELEQEHTAFQQDVQDFMSPFQSQVIDATLAEFDRNKAIQEQQIRDQQAALGALGSWSSGSATRRVWHRGCKRTCIITSTILQQGFNQAQAARQQDIQNRFGLAQATQGLGAFQSGLAGQQAQLGATTSITRNRYFTFRSLGALNQAQAQAQLDAQREAARQAAFLPQEQLDRFAGQVTGLWVDILVKQHNKHT